MGKYHERFDPADQSGLLRTPPAEGPIDGDGRSADAPAKASPPPPVHGPPLAVAENAAAGSPSLDHQDAARADQDMA